ncbi:MAG: UvrD-helicase domain-containing protein [Rickettsiales bacterium]
MYDQLNSQQIEACENTEGPLLILAGAGTGKTRVITQRIAYIISNGLAYPSQIMAVTFTNKAANEMLHRTESLIESNGIWIGTFHSLSTRIIRNHTKECGIEKDFTIIDTDDQWRLIKRIVREKNLDEKVFAPKIIAGIIGRWKDSGLFPENLTASDLTNHLQIRTKDIYHEYQKRLKILNALDFGDLLLFSLKLFKEHPEILGYYQEKFRYIMVDEYQDTNVVQYLWLRYLAQKHNNLCAVGDEDQSIYGFRGAEIRNILKFSHDFLGATIIRLEQNYRSTKHILSTANYLIANNTSRIGKNLWTDSASEEKVKILSHLNAYQEAEHIANKIKSLDNIPLNEIAILVRASFQTRIIEDIFIQHKISYNIVGGLKFYDRLEIKNSLAYIRLAYNCNDSLAFERIINTPKRGLGPATIAQIQTYANQHQCSYFSALQFMLENQYFKGKIFSTLQELLQKIKNWNELWQHMKPAEASNHILNESGYIESLKLENTLESESRLENIAELLRNIGEFKEITDFIEHVSLVNEIDSKNNINVVKIMTIHAAKGLEFNLVFLPGWEEGLFPSHHSLESQGEGLEEERRLAYVAITRAKNKLYISYANSRQVFGEWQSNQASRFITEIDHLDSIDHIKFSYNNYSKPISSHNSSYSLSSSLGFPSNSLNTDDSDIRIGDIVTHKKFGKGKVIATNGNNIDIAFVNNGLKKILKDFIEKI